ncbi:hypothetical protein Tco_1332403, partial [Tanacetum coccineum]
MGPTSSMGIIAGERIPYEAFPASIPQRHVAGENPDMSPGKRAIVVMMGSGRNKIQVDDRHGDDRQYFQKM